MSLLRVFGLPVERPLQKCSGKRAEDLTRKRSPLPLHAGDLNQED
ncbi:hypothetical protein ACPOL_1776 [Acidisarcina polymorpha]|uniref:Uncharacterized protein n=1 Tax=Acidisarcina polymorpha TaxID=2211140 RepID=A0A2Z5FW83_9BACT|nr:hypothetical protein ACPOL_1776 [Acidisarcina polymorpha]